MEDLSPTEVWVVGLGCCWIRHNLEICWGGVRALCSELHLSIVSRQGRSGSDHSQDSGTPPRGLGGAALVNSEALDRGVGAGGGVEEGVVHRSSYGFCFNDTFSVNP